MDPNIGLFLGSDTITGDMKKILFLLLLVLGWQEVVGQVKYPPIRPYRETDYTPEEAKQFAESGTSLAKSWRDSLFLVVRNGLFQALGSGKVNGQEEILSLNKAILEIEDGNIDYLLSRVSYENRELSGGFKNSRNENGVCRFYDDNNFVGTVGVFKLEGVVETIVYKTRCLNLLITEPVIIPSNATFRSMPPAPPSNPTGRFMPPAPPAKTSTSSFLEEEERFNYSPFIPQEDRGVPTLPTQKSWIAKNWYVIPVGLAIVTGITYAIIKVCKAKVGPIGEPEPRTMPEGIVGGGIPVFAF
ncbi:MAG TPA: hypothetical protein PLV35_00935 [Candidatus Paceibacterota bacterium]|nr:hypothetical protein [Candidatus Paceibacterota bacterium]